ncbi:MAG TPA: zinc ribbon domain-containing protein [Actinomycetota bacterium]|nr:zinc ribbon domain-containing protein [Actinomycetota bacterium]
MTERRCPRCGGLVGEDARWCGQCLARLDVDEPRSSATESGTERPPRREASDRPLPPQGGPIEVEDGRALWSCPSCGARNPLDDDVCPRCGRTFASLFQEPAPPPHIEARRAAALSLLAPGVGHFAAGRIAEGIARLIVFAYALGTALVVRLATGIRSAGPLVPLGWLSLAAAVALYVTSAVDAARVADRRDPVLSNRALLYGAIGLMMLTVIVLVVSGLRVTSVRDGGTAAPAW